MKFRPLFLFLFIAMFLASCSSTKILTENQYMLTKNTVTMEDVKGDEFSDMVNYVLPLPNNKFMGIFNARTSLYASTQPKVDEKTGEVKDTKFRRWLREDVGEPPVLLDSMLITNSETKLKTVMKKKGFFHAEVRSEVLFPKPKKAVVNYYIRANEPYYIRRVSMDIPVYEFRKILIVSMRGNEVKRGMRYDEDLISEEIGRMTQLLRNEGYYFANTSLFYCEVDTIGSNERRDAEGHRTLDLKFVLNTADTAAIERALYRYYFDKVSIHTNYNLAYGDGIQYDTTHFFPHRSQNDSTDYQFLTPRVKEAYGKNGLPKRDFKFRTITDKILGKYGKMYSDELNFRTRKGLNDLNNFNTIEISLEEDLARRDTINKIGYLNTEYKLVRRKVHSIGGQIDVRSDKSGLSFTYGNRNIFKGAENFSLNLNGSYYYYSKLYHYPEFGASIKIDFPRLFLFKKYEKSTALKYSTSLTLGGTYSGLYNRWMFNASYFYTYQPNINISHTITPIDFRTLNTDESRSKVLFSNYFTKSYLERFERFFLLSFKYSFNYVVPFKHYHKKNNMRFTISYESSGMLLTGLNALFTPSSRWKLGQYNYTAYQALEFNWQYNHTINENNAVAMRFNAGVKLPIFSGNIIPYETGYYLGGSNSMRGFPFRGVGPGSYNNGTKIEYTGDVKLEMNFEYRGTIYKAFKYGVFIDAGNVWLSRKYEGMDNAEFRFDRFYKEIALCAGVGIRLDFNFFIIRLDYAVPFYDPRASQHGGPWINKHWTEGATNLDKVWNWAQGFKFAIGHAF